MNRRNSDWYTPKVIGWFAFIVMSLCAIGAYAGVTSTPQPTQYLIRLSDKTYEKGKTVPQSLEECRARAQAIMPHADCVTIEGFDNVGTCADVARPDFPAVVENGFLKKPAIRVPVNADGTWGATEMEGYVAAPYPTCWVMGWVPYVQDVTPDTASVDEPVVWPASLVAVWNESCAERHAHGVVYEGDAC